MGFPSTAINCSSFLWITQHWSLSYRQLVIQIIQGHKRSRTRTSQTFAKLWCDVKKTATSWYREKRFDTIHTKIAKNVISHPFVTRSLMYSRLVFKYIKCHVGHLVNLLSHLLKKDSSNTHHCFLSCPQFPLCHLDNLHDYECLRVLCVCACRLVSHYFIR